VLEPLAVGRHGTEVHVGRFISGDYVKAHRRNFGPLILLEVTSFLVERFASVQVVHYTLHRDIEMKGDGLRVACARAELLHRIGAVGVTINPRPDPGTPGNFVLGVQRLQSR
jgi:hypothetical protein